ncbi:MAG: Arc family DNA-binding protein [Gammaproteobacteria bacterium]
MSKRDYPSHSAQRFVVRFPPGMKESLTAFATKNHRTLTAEVVARLEWSMRSAVQISAHGVPATAPSFTVRLPNGMRGELHALAEQHGLSVNDEIVSRLQASLGRDAYAAGSPPPLTVGDEGRRYPPGRVFDLVARLSPRKRRALEVLLDDVG